MEIKISLNIEGMTGVISAIHAAAVEYERLRLEVNKTGGIYSNTNYTNAYEGAMQPVQQPPVQVAEPQYQVPVQQPQPQFQQQATVQQPPVQPVQQPLPTTAATYTQEMLAKAATQIMDAGRLAELQGLLSQFGITSLMGLPPARYGEFATALRGLGAKI